MTQYDEERKAPAKVWMPGVPVTIGLFFCANGLDSAWMWFAAWFMAVLVVACFLRWLWLAVVES